MTLDDISEELLLDCASMVKANSIAGCKKNHVYVVYTRWKNLKKTNDMVDGQVGFHRPENVRRYRVEKNGPIVRQIEKSKRELYPDLYQQQQDRQRGIQREKQQAWKKERELKKEQQRQAKLEKEAKSYDRVLTTENMTSNTEVEATADSTAAEAYEDDFF